MSEGRVDDFGRLRPSQFQRIDAVCDRFETDWRSGRRPRIEEVLQAEPASCRPELLRHLLAVELAYRRRNSEAPTPDEYRHRFPGDAELIDRLFGGTVNASTDRGGQGPGPDSGGEVPTVSFVGRPEGQNDGAAVGLEQIGKYRVIRRLGSGGQATAILAFDPYLERHIVLKRYHLGSDNVRTEQALMEGRALARVRSPHVARCFGAERHGDEILLIVEYVPGLDLARAHREQPLGLARAVRVVAQAAEGLAAVHACGLLHRDLKPANILLGDDGLARLVDFGLVAGVGSAALGELSGTPAYMAPEQARAEPERIDPRTDVFGLGAVLYFLLTRLPPHQGRDLVETLERARRCRITPPREHNRGVPRGLEQICLKALAATPEQRYASAADLQQALCHFRATKRGCLLAIIAALLLLALLLLGTLIMLSNTAAEPFQYDLF